MLALLSILFTLVCIFMIFIIVVQPAQGEGLASAFGGGISETFFGTKAGQHMNRFTVVLAITFLLLAIVINLMNKSPSTQKEPPPPPAQSQPAK